MPLRSSLPVSDSSRTGIATRPSGRARPQPPTGAGTRRPVPSAYARFGKPVLDRVGAALLLLLCAPLMTVIALLVLGSLGRPVLLRQRRVGRGGRSFIVLKFRTMEPDRRVADRGAPRQERRRTHKHPRDPRLTGVGRTLRRLSLDELPQLLNVLCGDMSLVGPRPELPEIVARHYAPWQHRRHLVKPGLTGLWQVSARGQGLMHEHGEMDVAYVDQVSLRTDLRVLLRTLPAAFGTHKGF